MEVLKESTKSLCNLCCQEIEAKIFAEGGQVIMEKYCPRHGLFNSLVEKDIDCYRDLAHFKNEKGSGVFDALIIPVTYQCNLACSFCYLPSRGKEDIKMEKLREIIANFKGNVIALSGGEPTLRSDLPQILKLIKETGKFSLLITNGLRLEDISYLRMLKSAGLHQVFFSLDGFDNKMYRLIKGAEDILDKELKALDNLRREKINTRLSVTIYKGINEGAIRKTFEFAVTAGSFITQIRIRSCTKVGHFKENIDGYYISETLSLFAEAVNTTRKDLLRNFLCRHSYNTPHHLDLVIYFYKKGEKIFVLPYISRILNMVSFSIIGPLKYLKFFSLLERTGWGLKKHRRIFSKMNIRIISWPNIENIDINEVDRGTAHLYGGRILNFCHAIVLNRKL